MSDRTCTFPDCDKRDVSRGLCAGHASQRRKGQELRPLGAYAKRQEVISGVPCAAPGCSRQSAKRGYCDTHYGAARQGRTFARLDLNDEERFFSYVAGESPSGCWPWGGTLNQDGYGIWRRSRLAHRWSYEFLRAPIPDGLVIDHLCRVRNCVNPWHMEPVLPVVNWDRGTAPSAVNKRKTHCVHGHEFTPENTVPRRTGGRRCRACMNAYNARVAARRRVSTQQGLANG